MGDTKDEWYFSQGGQRSGPVGFAELLELARDGHLHPRTDLVIGGVLEDWVPAGQVEGLFERREAGADGQAAGAEGRPADDSLADSGNFEFGEKPAKLDLPGATRSGYILGTLVLPAILGVGLTKLVPELAAFAGPEFGPFAPLVLLVIPLLVVVLTVKRFQNLGMRGWWTLGLLVPVMNWWLGYRLVACPPGYVFSRRLDVPGWILAVLYWLWIGGSLVAAFLFGAIAISQLMESGELQRLLNQLEEMKAASPAR